MITRPILLLLVAALMLCRVAAAAALEKSELVIEAAGGKLRFTVELAKTEQEKALGLMFRRDLEPDAGMLFLYPEDREITMWMENTLLPLDMIFFAVDGRITKIAERTVPLSRATIGSDGPARGVVEVNGGTAARLGIKVGDRVELAP